MREKSEDKKYDTVVRNTTDEPVLVWGANIAPGDTATFKNKTLTEIAKGTDPKLRFRIADE
jgi:hypothetical protein